VVAHGWLDALVVETLPVFLRVPRVEVTRTSLGLNHDLTEETLRALVADGVLDLPVHALVGRHFIEEGVAGLPTPSWRRFCPALSNDAGAATPLPG
jgi:hypothetical protein